MMDLGFTGTRRGMTERQSITLRGLLYHLNAENNDDVFHHGGAIGADTEAATLAKQYEWQLEEHLPEDEGAEFLLARNCEIVEACDLLIAAPASLKEVRRSGTWYTIRFARRVEKSVIILDP
jgi:hypothetical protein